MEITALGATHPDTTILTTVQAEVAEGPCLSDAWQEGRIYIENLENDDRWPHYRESGLTRTALQYRCGGRLRIVAEALPAVQ
jgi:hypothetical protein